MAWKNGKWVSDFDGLGPINADGSGGVLNTPITSAVVDKAAFKAFIPSTGVATPQSQFNWSDLLSKDTLSGAAGVLGGAGSVMQGLGALEAADLAKKQFGFEKGLANRNLANQATLANIQMQNAADVGLALGGGAMTPEQIAASKAATAQKMLSTSPIG